MYCIETKKHEGFKILLTRSYSQLRAFHHKLLSTLSFPATHSVKHHSFRQHEASTEGTMRTKPLLTTTPLQDHLRLLADFAKERLTELFKALSNSNIKAKGGE
ncbi:hypothetical protein QVD17_41587 [Tagetes erecta]|uniref:Uncharacterized protein n=1 Tax=Tagetes erecta TaxID=13708 RepID=A0AAD8NDT3_TARER|nr:hypothetical protein QVD17_41587 [Tagetes erecta]